MNEAQQQIQRDQPDREADEKTDGQRCQVGLGGRWRGDHFEALLRRRAENGWHTEQERVPRRFRAFDARTGKEIWTANLEANANANPMSYQGKSGKQYVAVVAGNTLMVYSL